MSTVDSTMLVAESVAPCLELVAVDATTDLDHIVFREDAFDLPLREQRRLREVHVREALGRHLAGCAQYAAFARRQGVGDWTGIELEAIPVVPTSVFKSETVLSVSPGEIQKYCLSSGTGGVQSRIGRDRTSLERLLGSVRAGISLIESWYEDEVEVVHLGPDREEAGDIWFLYVMSLIELMYPTRHFVHGGALDAAGAVDRVFELLRPGGPHVALVGAPFQIRALVDILEQRDLRLEAGSRMTVFSAGGWKRASGSRIPREEFDARVSATLGLAAGHQIRDAYNQVELNTVFVECSAHRKHVPPWVYAATRDPRRLAVQPVGTVGVLSYLDASATSYPAFLLTDDVGTVDEGSCPCGREGVTVQIARRLTSTAARGCALTLDRRTKRPNE